LFSENWAAAVATAAAASRQIAMVINQPDMVNVLKLP
jgi:hypothetical protein